MIEMVVSQTTMIDGRMGSRQIGILRFDENDPSVPPEMLQPLDGRTLAVILGGLRRIAADHAKAWQDFGDPTQPGAGGAG